MVSCVEHSEDVFDRRVRRTRAALRAAAVEHQLAELVAALRRSAAVDTVRLTGLGVRVLFEHAREHRRLYLAMINGAAGGAPLRRYVEVVTTAFQGLVLRSVKS